MQTDFFATVRRVVRQYGGVVEKYIGDAVMVLFGAPGGHRDRRGALRAGRAGPAAGAGPVRRRPARDELRVPGRRRHRRGAGRRGRRPRRRAGDRRRRRGQHRLPAAVRGAAGRGAGLRHHARADHGPRSATPRSRRSPCAGGPRRPRCGWPWPRCAAADRPGRRTPPRWSAATTSWACWSTPCTACCASARRSWSPCSAGPASARAGWSASCTGTPSRLVDDAGLPGAPGAARRSARTSRTPRSPTSSRPQAGILDTDPRRAARRAARRRRSRDLVGPARGGPALRRAAPAGRPARLAAVHRGGRVGVAAVPARAGRARPDRAGLRGPALGRRRDAALRRAARRDRPGRAAAAASAPPGRSWSTATRAGPARSPASVTDHAAAAARRPASPRSTRTCSARRRSPPTLLRPLVELADGKPLYAHEYVPDAGRAGHAAPVRTRLVAGAAAATCRCRRACTRSSPTGSTCSTPSDRAVLQAAAVVGVQFWPGAVAAALGSRSDVGRAGAAPAGAARPRARAGRLDDGRRAGVPVPARAGPRRLLPAAAAHRAGRPARADRRLARRAAARAGTPTWPRCSPTTAAPRYEIARTLGHGRRPVRRAGARRAAPGGPPGVRAARPRRGRRPRGPGARAWRDDDRPGRAGCGWSCSAPRSRSTGTRRRSSPAAGPSSSPTLADRLYAHGDHGGAARAWTLLGQAAWLRADRAGALPCLDRAVELFDDAAGHARRRPTRTPSWAGCTCSTTSTTPAVGRGRARPPRSPSGSAWSRLRANARITIGTRRYQAGDRDGLVELQARLEFCRAQQLLRLRRAVQNLAYALREEGDWPRSDALLSSSAGAHGRRADADHRLLGARRCGPTSTGDWAALLAAADAFLDTPTGEWDMQVRGRCARWLRVLRGEPGRRRRRTPDRRTPLRRRRRAQRLLPAAVDRAGPRRALPGAAGPGATRRRRCSTSWPRAGGGARRIASGEWIAAAAHAAALAGRDAAVRVRDDAGRRAAPHALVGGGAADGHRRRSPRPTATPAGRPSCTWPPPSSTAGSRTPPTGCWRSPWRSRRSTGPATRRPPAARGPRCATWSRCATQRPGLLAADRLAAAGRVACGPLSRVGLGRRGGRLFDLLRVHVDVLAAGELISSYMISSVTARSMNRSPAIPA